MSDYTRPDWVTYWMGVADAISARADCRRRKIGAVYVNEENSIIGSGYNGAPPGLPGCLEGACPRGQLTFDQLRPDAPYDDPAMPSYCISVHAEGNAQHRALAPVKGSTLYVGSCTPDVPTRPCPRCSKDLAVWQVKEVYWRTASGIITRSTPLELIPVPIKVRGN